MKKVIYLVIAMAAISCSTEYPYYNTSQNYKSTPGVDGNMIYTINTTVYRFTNGKGSADDVATSVYASEVKNISSSKVDSVTLHERSIANMRVSEFNHLDELTKPSDN